MANQPNSLAWNVEEWLVDILRAGGVIPSGFSIEHFNSKDRADKDRIVIRATVGERDLGGSRPWNVAAEIERISVTLPEATAESYDAAIDDAVDSPEVVASLAHFTDLFHLSSEDEQKEAAGQTRKRSKTFNFLALEAELLPLDFNNASVNFNDAGHNFSEAA